MQKIIIVFILFFSVNLNAQTKDVINLKIKTSSVTKDEKPDLSIVFSISDNKGGLIVASRYESKFSSGYYIKHYDENLKNHKK